jgi:serine/threonine-protein kinase RsbW
VPHDHAARVLQARADPDCLSRVHELVAALWADAPDVAGVDRITFETAVAEVAANIVQHAAAEGVVDFDLEVRAFPDRLEALFADNGLAADVDVAARELPDETAESGRGIALAWAALDELTYQRDGAVNRWRLVRRRGRG